MDLVSIKNKEDGRIVPRIPKQDAIDFYCKRGWEILDPQEDKEDSEEVKETADQLDAEEKVGEKVVPETPEVADDKSKVIPSDASVADEAKELAK